MNILAIIPARGGSKGITGKNTRELLGKPMIVYTIEAALRSAFLKSANIFCSTESETIAQLAVQNGIQVIPRPEELARDDSSTADVLLHALDFVKNQGGETYDLLLLLQPTSPLRTEKHIDAALQLMIDKRPDSVVSVCVPRHSPYLMKKINAAGSMENFVEHPYSRRQQMPSVYALNGAIYITSVDHFIAKQGFYGNHNLPFIMKYEESIDVDELFDLELAEFIVSKRNNTV